MVAPSALSVKITRHAHVAAVEEITTGFWILQAAPPTLASLNALLAEVAADWDTSAAGPSNAIITTDTVWDRWDAYAYDGTSNTAVFHAVRPITVNTTGASNSPLPLQVCMVATLRTPLAGRRHRGRMFMPANGAAVDGDHDFTAAQTTALSNGLAAFFTLVNAHADIGFVAVHSSVSGEDTPVSSVTVDSRPDIQRRRAGSQVATSSHSAAVT